MAPMNLHRQGTWVPTSAAPGRDSDGPAFELLHRLDDQIEIRRYAPYAVAEVFIDAVTDEADRQALALLTGYLGGKNLGTHTLAMTGPVTRSALDGGTLLRFILPRGVSVASAPQPTDSRVVRREVAVHTLAALRYAGGGSPIGDAVQFERLAAALRTARLAHAGAPWFVRHHTPWTPTFLRRHEVWLRLPTRVAG
jgi:SOUL heme-binding protein